MRIDNLKYWQVGLILGTLLFISFVVTGSLK